jgi:hypothetical protein
MSGYNYLGKEELEMRGKKQVKEWRRIARLGSHCTQGISLSFYTLIM